MQLRRVLPGSQLSNTECQSNGADRPVSLSPAGNCGACYIQNLDAEIFNLVSIKDFSWLECKAFSAIPWLVHGFGTRQGGESKDTSAAQSSTLSTGSWPAETQRKRRGFLQAIGAGNLPLAVLHQTHSAIIYCVSQSSGGHLRYQLAGNPLPETESPPRTRSGDALMTQHAGIMLGIRVADCMPILMVDCEKRVIAAVHAGWRGALNRIVEKAVGEMCRMFNSRPENLFAAIGPSIRGCCYEVGPEVVDAFCGAFPSGEDFFHRVMATPEEARMALRYQTLFSLQAPPGHQAEDVLSKVHLDLAAVARYQLEQAGITPQQIYTADYCTACRTDLFFSYRKEGSLAGRMMVVIGMRPQS